MPKLYNPDPRATSTFTLYTNWSFRDSLGSYQNGAWKERSILRHNHRIPTFEVVWHLTKVFSAKEISAYRTKTFRYLKEHGIEAVANIELTRGEDGEPNDKTHFHILSDDTRSEDEIRKLFNTACLRSGLNRKDFRIDYRELYDGYAYFDYFVKYGKRFSNKVILFQKGIKGLDKFYRIGNWFRESKKKLWKGFLQDKYGTDSDKTVCVPDEDEELPDELKQEFDATIEDEVPVDGISMDLERSYQLERYGVDLDEVTGGNESITRLYILGVGKFRKVSGAGWFCIDEFNLLCKPIHKVRTKVYYDCPNVGGTPAWNKCSSDYRLSRTVRIRDRRHEWKRFRYSIAFRQ